MTAAPPLGGDAPAATPDLPPRDAQEAPAARPSPPVGDGYQPTFDWWQPERSRPDAFATNA